MAYWLCLRFIKRLNVLKGKRDAFMIIYMNWYEKEIMQYFFISDTSVS